MEAREFWEFILERWALIVADYRREYGMSPEGLRGLSLDEFMWLLKGLSKRSEFMRLWREKPKTLHDPADRAALIARARA